MKESKESGDSNSTDSCPICLEHYQNKTVLESCYHSFCFDCILKWSKTSSSSCPMCKSPLTFGFHSIQSDYSHEIVILFYSNR